ncbi:MAG: DciA family protein [Pseudomonadota bacterium]
MSPSRPISRSIPRQRLTFERLGTRLDGLTRKAFTKFGFADDHVLTRWQEIVGPQMARLTSPERLSRPQKGKSGGSTLTVRVAGAAALEMQHLAPQIIDKINGFYGRPMVARLKLVQGPLPKPAGKPKPQASAGSLFGSSAPARKPAITPNYDIEDPDLARALARLEQAVAE